MAYREENGQVVLTMPREDFETILMALGAFTVVMGRSDGTLHRNRMLRLLNRLNEGNPNYTPYAIVPKL
jgi:hypothetical protein